MFTDQVQHVGDVGGIGTVVLKLSPVPCDESVVPGLRLSIQSPPPTIAAYAISTLDVRGIETA